MKIKFFILQTKKPKEGISIAQTRLKDAMALDMELAEYFKERSQIEEVYAKSLAKASKRLYTMDPGVLGFVLNVSCQYRAFF